MVSMPGFRQRVERVRPLESEQKKAPSRAESVVIHGSIFVWCCWLADSEGKKRSSSRLLYAISEG